MSNQVTIKIVGPTGELQERSTTGAPFRRAIQMATRILRDAAVDGMFCVVRQGARVYCAQYHGVGPLAGRCAEKNLWGMPTVYPTGGR